MSHPDPLQPYEMQALIHLLDELSIVQSNAGCNDLEWPATPDNIAFAALYNQRVPPEEQLKVSSSTIEGQDISVTAYLASRLRNLLEHSR